MKLYTVVSFPLLLAVGCANVRTPETVAYDKTTQARVRAIKGALIRFYPGKECSSPTLLAIGDEGYSATGGVFAGLESNKRIGMPLLSDTAKAFNEHLVPANTHLTVEGLFAQKIGNTQYTCGPVIGTFVPSAGKDYEIALERAGGGCILKLREIAFVGAEEKPVSVHFSASSRCEGFRW
jgi:hypothetical protein